MTIIESFGKSDHIGYNYYYYNDRNIGQSLIVKNLFNDTQYTHKQYRTSIRYIRHIDYNADIVFYLSKDQMFLYDPSGQEINSVFLSREPSCCARHEKI